MWARIKAAAIAFQEPWIVANGITAVEVREVGDKMQAITARMEEDRARLSTLTKLTIVNTLDVAIQAIDQLELPTEAPARPAAVSLKGAAVDALRRLKDDRPQQFVDIIAQLRSEDRS